MFVKIEILLWLLLTLVLLLTPIVYFFKNYESLTYTRRTKYRLWTEKRKKKRLAKSQEKSNKQMLEAQEEVVNEQTLGGSQENEGAHQESIEEEILEIDTDDGGDEDVDIDTPDVPIDDQKKTKVVAHDPHKHTPTQEQRIKDQKKIDEVRISALSYKERGKMEDYEKKLIEGLALDPDNKEFEEWLSGYYFQNGQFIKALSLLKKIVNESPDHHKAIRQIGQIYMHQGDYDTAKILIEKAISVKDDNPKYYITLVDILYTKNDIHEAIKAMEKVLKLRPKNVKYLLSIATLHEEIAEPSKATHYYGKIIELDPMNDLAKKGIQRLG